MSESCHVGMSHVTHMKKSHDVEGLSFVTKTPLKFIEAETLVLVLYCEL